MKTEERRLPASQVRRRVRSGENVLVVCAYDDDLACNEILLKGALTYSEFKLRLPSLPRTQEIVFYCACRKQEKADRRAQEYRRQGYENAHALEGGAEAWLTLAGEEG